MKKLLNLKGLKVLTKQEQKSINGGVFTCAEEGMLCYTTADCCPNQNLLCTDGTGNGIYTCVKWNF